MIYRRLVEKNDWKVGDLALARKNEMNEKLEYTNLSRHSMDSYADNLFEKTDLTLEEAKLIIAL